MALLTGRSYMARTSIIWNHRNLQIWRLRGSRAELLHEAEVDSVDTLISVLEREAKELKISKLRVYLDRPELDHHIERVPQMTPKLRQQLLKQRKIKLYGNEDRVWVSHDMALNPAGAQHFYFISSLPNLISRAIAEWAFGNAILLEGIFSLPLALATTREEADQADEAFMHFQALGQAGYLIARNDSGKLLFLTRLDTHKPSEEALDASARRLLLFLEQEFAVTPKLLQARETDEGQDALIVAQMSRKRVEPGLKLISREDRNRQSRQRLRHRVFALLSMGLIITLYINLPLMQKKKDLQLSLSELSAQIKSEELSLQRVKERIRRMQKYKLVIEFSEGRETIDPEGPIPSPLIVIMQGLSNALPDFVELDSYEGLIDLTNATASVTMEGRPLTADINLSERVQQMHDGLKKQGWLISDPELSFEKKTGGSRFSNQRGELRKFILQFQIKAKGGAN